MTDAQKAYRRTFAELRAHHPESERTLYELDDAVGARLADEREAGWADARRLLERTDVWKACGAAD